MTLPPDLRGALRALRRRPGTALVAALALGLGSGAAAATFALLDRVVLEPLPVAGEESLVVAWGRHRTRSFDRFPWSLAAWERIAEGARSAEALAAAEAAGARQRLLEERDRRTPVAVSRVLGDYFGALGARPALGRLLAPADDVAGGARVAVVSHRLWQRRWAGGDAALGAKLVLEGEPYTVVGVAPDGLDHPHGTDVWVPLRPELAPAAGTRPGVELALVARLAPGASAGEFGAEIERLLAGDPALAPVYAEVEPVVESFRDVVLGETDTLVVALFAGALLLLVVAAVDVVQLAWVRADERAAAWAVRRALGADAAHLTLGWAVESLAIVVLAGVAAAAVLLATLGAVLPLAPSGLPRLAEVRAEPATWLVLAAILAASWALLVSIPALRVATAPQLSVALRSGSRVERGDSRSRTLIVAAQAALALWAVATSALLVRSLGELRALELGFATEDLELVQIDHRHAIFAVPPEWPRRAQAAIDRLEAHPGVAAATAVVAPPLVANGGLDVVPTLPGDPVPDVPLPYFNLELTQPGHFAALRRPLLRGRATTSADAAGAAPALVVDEAAARALWPGREPLGERLRLPFPGYENVDWTVVGVAADARYRELLDFRPSLYVPLAQMPIVAPRWIAVRTAAPLDAAAAVAAAFAEADPSVRVVGATPAAARLAAPLARPRLALAVIGEIALFVLVLAAVGAYGVVAASARRRNRELGVRIVCGATPGDVGRRVLGDGLAPVAAGATVGALAALAAGGLVESLLFGVQAHDPSALVAATAVVLTATSAACLPPALRAAKLDPAALLRDDA